MKVASVTEIAKPRTNLMPKGKGTYGSKVGRPPKKKKKPVTTMPKVRRKR